MEVVDIWQIQNIGTPAITPSSVILIAATVTSPEVVTAFVPRPSPSRMTV